MMKTETKPALRPRRAAASLDELLAGATSREPMDKDAESLSGSAFDRVVIAGQPYVLKHLHVDDDWIQRLTGDVVCRPLVAWESGLFDALPPCVDHTVVGVAKGLGRNGWGAAVLMRDVSPYLVRIEDGLSPEQHLRFLDDMAQLHAHFWGFRDTVGLMPMQGRWSVMTPHATRHEVARGATDAVPRMVAPGWERISRVAPASYRVVEPLFTDPAPLVRAAMRTPLTLVHGDWKAGNLGTLPDGRTILLDWAFPGCGPACVDIAWYVAVNCDLLPHSKEDTLEVYREALRRHGVSTDGWWELQVALTMVGAFAFLGWSKDGEELAWWDERIPAWARLLQ